MQGRKEGKREDSERMGLNGREEGRKGSERSKKDRERGVFDGRQERRKEKNARETQQRMN